MLDVAQEFGFKIAAFHHGVEAYKLAGRLAKEGVCGALWADWWGFKMEAYDGIPENIAHRRRAGRRLRDRPLRLRGRHPAPEPGSGQGDDARQPRGLRDPTGARDPLDHREPAKALGILDQTGTLEAGKMADVVIWNGTPFSRLRARRPGVRGRRAALRPRASRREAPLGLLAVRKLALIAAALLLAPALAARAGRPDPRRARAHRGRRGHARKCRRPGAGRPHRGGRQQASPHPPARSSSRRRAGR